MKNIGTIAGKFGIRKKDIIFYGEHLAKIKPILDTPHKNKKLILVTAISPTTAGEGKTTVSIGLNDALNRIGKNSVVALREPSMGPVFGVKGGANGGGKAQVVPKEDIDLHFTGDFHAITSANNLIAACIDNHIYWGNELNIDINNIVWRRVLDMNDRSLREVTINIDTKKGLFYKSGFDITVASELMAIFCLSNTPEELRKRIGDIIVAYTKDQTPIYVKQLNITNAVMKILQNALLPNIVQSLEGNLALIHGGPFANIAHGCNSLFATKTAMNIADYTVTEAGFGSDLGVEKFIDIVCDNGKLQPNVVVLVASIRSLKLHGGTDPQKLTEEDITSLTKGLDNLKQHINNITAFGLPWVIAINQFASDTTKELNILKKFFHAKNIEYSFTTLFADGSKGAVDLAEKVVKLANVKTQLKPVYNMKDNLETKILAIVKRCYGGIDVEYSELAKSKLKQLNNKSVWVCMAKTPLTFSDDPKEIIVSKPITIHVKDLLLANGVNFVIVMAGSIFRMPGLPKTPAAHKF